ncbi:hypothetical protein CPB84DRAFT_1347827 [Gymnopilus junonius]|uniref:Uncharacterized protein n=1 Tax=Gymnopilus junonius TaxID=109634 RepID=A0A9P5TRS2_GYMJU|nr:hypothetical protein CPB84DRAFT_1347827 [Gymnopilus junonius]
MSEEDRAAKAARAKALLKKRQQKKAADSAAAVADSIVTSPATPPRTFSPAPSEPIETDNRDLGDVSVMPNKAAVTMKVLILIYLQLFQGHSDTSWLSSLPRVASPPPPAPHVAPPAHRVYASPPKLVTVSSDLAVESISQETSALREKLGTLTKENETLATTVNQLKVFETAALQAEASLEAERKHVKELKESYQKLQDDSEIALQNEHQTVALLVSEKAHLTAELQRRDDLESQVEGLENQLESERSKAKNLDDQVFRLKKEVQDARQRAKQSELKEKELFERCKEQERQLQIASTAAAEARKEAEESQRKLRELEEQVQSDDRAERLEASLKNTQDRAAELEFQLTKLKQVCSSLKSERDNLESTAAESAATEAKLTTQISEFQNEITKIRQELSTVKEERGSLSHEQSRLQQLTEAHENTIKGHEEKLVAAASSISGQTRQIQSIQGELKNANRRADDAEKTQKNLQAEGTKLMQALDEMRPKIVELTAVKLELSEKIESLEHTIQNRDGVILQLENDLGEARDQNEQMEEVWKQRLTEQEKRHKEVQNGSADIQKAYNELQEDLETTLASLRNLESERANQHQEASRRLEEIEHLRHFSQTQGEELESLRRELEARKKSHEEEQDFLERTQNEIETLRAEISARDLEIERLQEVVNSPTNSDAPHTLDDEMLSSIRQQHAMDLSAATSQIRALENTIFDKDSLNHSLQKQINALEEQLSQLRSHSRLGVPSRPSSRAMEHDTRWSSLHSHRSNQPPPLSRTIFDHAMTPETLHKRQVSLSMLKARIESETTSTPPSRVLSPVHSEGRSHKPSSKRPSTPHLHRPQFLDESHVFWCHSCQGDLVIL